jgi:hypothetical protein
MMEVGLQCVAWQCMAQEMACTEGVGCCSAREVERDCTGCERLHCAWWVRWLVLVRCQMLHHLCLLRGLGWLDVGRSSVLVVV